MQIMVGHLGREALAAASVGNTWYNLLFYFQIGFGTALDTLASQAFGAGDNTALCSATMTSLVAGTGAALPMMIGLLVTGPVAEQMFAQPHDIAQQTAAFCTRLVPGVLPQVPLLQMRTFLGCMTQSSQLCNIHLEKAYAFDQSL